ncbi:MAG: TetR/AcrR family transcriptional regulator [Rectinemataceae bacterium]
MDVPDNKDIRWTAVFERIPEDKRRRVLDSAKRAFAAKGFAGTNVNLVAEAAGISVGSLYQYFRTKDDLFLALIDEFHLLLESTLNEIFASESSFFGRVEAVLRAAVRSSLEDPDLVRLYIACTTDELAFLSERLSNRIEGIASDLYRSMVREAQERGEIDGSADPATTAFCLDDIFLIVQFSFGSDYYRERLRRFVGEGALDDPESLIAGIMRFVRRALGPR